LYRSITRVYCCLVFGLFLSTQLTDAAADTIYLGNGDRITGKVISIADGVVVFQTEYAGEVNIALHAVDLIDSAQAVVVQRDNGTLLEGAFEIRDGEQGIQQNGSWYPIVITDITLLVPDAASDTEVLEPEAKPEIPQRWSGTVESGLTMRSGNTDTTDYTFSSMLKRAGTRDILTLNFGAAYGEAQDVINTRRYRGSAKWQFYPRERLFWYGTASGERDDGRKLDYRAVVGLGIGYDIIKSEQRSLSADIGLDYTWEQWAAFTPAERDAARVSLRNAARNDLLGVAQGISSDTLNFNLENIRFAYSRYRDFRNPLRHITTRKEDYSNIRIGADYSQALLRSSTLTDAIVLYGNLEDFGEYRVVNELAFNTPLSESLSLKVSLKSEYDSLASDSGVESWDHLLMTTLGFRF